MSVIKLSCLPNFSSTGWVTVGTAVKTANNSCKIAVTQCNCKYHTSDGPKFLHNPFSDHNGGIDFFKDYQWLFPRESIGPKSPKDAE